jgi:hypothetical protein
MAFGAPTRYLTLDPMLAAGAAEDDALPPPGGGAGGKDREAAAAAVWDAGVDAGCSTYSRRFHNICCDNCHHHVANCLSSMRYQGRSNWGQVELAAMLLFRGRFVSTQAALATWAPFLLLVTAIVLLRVFL